MSNQPLWSESFGDEYTVRNDGDFDARCDFFKDLFKRYPVKNILEVGCNTGTNLIGLSNAWGCDVNQKALRMCRTRHNEINAVYASGFDLPFKDDVFQCAFTCGVLIHQKPGEVEGMMQEIIRVSSQYVLAMEYASTMFQEIPYRGQKEALFKGPYGEIYEKRYGLRLVETGFLGHDKGFDEITYWMMKI
jgi:pseudaminic acid biosynthesis-associated methylase